MSTQTVTLDKATHSYLAGGTKVALCVSDVLSLSGIKQPFPEIPIVQNHVEHARILGETVHDWTQFLDAEGSTLDILDLAALQDSAPAPYVLAYQRFREEHLPEWEHVETSFADTAIDCAGTPDRIGTIVQSGSRIPVIIDIKTLDKAPKKERAVWQIQLSAYQYLSRRLDCALFVLHLRKDASFKLIEYEPDIETFLAAVRVAQWRVKNDKRVK